MHISDGVLTPKTLIAGAAATVFCTYLGLSKLKHEKIPQTAILSSAFFIASLIHVPLGPTSVHLLLNGLVGVILGWIAFPALLIALFLQAILFQFGGLTTLGVNTFNMAFPAVLAYYLTKPLIRMKSSVSMTLAGCLAAATGVGVGGILVALELTLTGKAFIPVAKLVLLAHLPVIVIESIVISTVLNFLRRARPELLEESL